MNISVTNTATMIGINDVGQFSVLFKKIMNISQKQYQNTNEVSGVHFAAIAATRDVEVAVNVDSDEGVL